MGGRNGISPDGKIVGETLAPAPFIGMTERDG
jgi:hypothetical protein